jgi:hypothetical protein
MRLHVILQISSSRMSATRVGTVLRTLQIPRDDGRKPTIMNRVANPRVIKCLYSLGPLWALIWVLGPYGLWPIYSNISRLSIHILEISTNVPYHTGKWRVRPDELKKDSIGEVYQTATGQHTPTTYLVMYPETRMLSHQIQYSQSLRAVLIFLPVIYSHSFPKYVT